MHSSLRNCLTGDVALTGWGVVSPLGPDLSASFARLMRGESAIRPVTLELGTQVFGAPASSHATAELAEEPLVAMTLQASQEAIARAGLNLAEFDPARVGCVIGTSKAGLRSFSSFHDALHTDTDQDQLTQMWSRCQLSSPAEFLARRLTIEGPVLTPVAACATGMLAVQRGVQLIQEGLCDVVFAGSADASLVEIVVASYRKLGILARDQNTKPMCRPFDRDRDGFVIGEGAGVLILQRAQSLTPQQTPLVRYVGGANLSTASDLTSLAGAAEDYVQLLGRTLTNAGLKAEQIGLINLHGTATRDNDLLEMQAVSKVLGSHTPCVGFKGALGHLLGAAGAVELIFALEALCTGTSPQTVGCQNIDPTYTVDIITDRPRPIDQPHLLKVSAGFGGHLIAGIFQRL